MKSTGFIQQLLGVGMVAMVLGIGSMAAQADDPFSPLEKNWLSQIDKANQVQLNRILDDQLDGSLKKPEVRDLTARLNGIVAGAYQTAKDSDLTDQAGQATLSAIGQVGHQITQRETANLAYCRRTNQCPDKGSKISPINSPSY